MKLHTSTLGLLQLSAAALVYAQLPFHKDMNEDLQDLCIPGSNSEVQDRTSPCFRAPDIAYECRIGETMDKEASTEDQHKCICKSEMFEYFKG